MKRSVLNLGLVSTTVILTSLTSVSANGYSQCSSKQTYEDVVTNTGTAQITCSKTSGFTSPYSITPKSGTIRIKRKVGTKYTTIVVSSSHDLWTSADDTILDNPQR
jgi:hypothetical protein